MERIKIPTLITLQLKTEKMSYIKTLKLYFTAEKHELLNYIKAEGLDALKTSLVSEAKKILKCDEAITSWHVTFKMEDVLGSHPDNIDMELSAALNPIMDEEKHP